MFTKTLKTQELDKIFKETNVKREELRKELKDLSKKRQERINAVLTQEQLEKYEQDPEGFPEHPGQPKPWAAFVQVSQSTAEPPISRPCD